MYYQSPVGLLNINMNDGFINEIIFIDEEKEILNDKNEEDHSNKNKIVLEKCRQQLDEYFAGKRTQFDFAIHQGGTVFQQKAWNELLNIPFGKTISYLQLSQRIGNEKVKALELEIDDLPN